jgi:hypothetical protein
MSFKWANLYRYSAALRLADQAWTRVVDGMLAAPEVRLCTR